jgi:CheY-like chemotaxis protein
VADVAARDNVLAWMVGDVGREETDYRARIGCFPDADLPLVECTTIPCASDSSTGGWVVVCKDLRDLSDAKTGRQACDKLAPLSNLRALAEALYGMAEYLDDQRRFQAVEVIEKHTLALQSLLAEMLHRGEGEDQPELDLDFVDIASLLASTRRLLEIQPVGEGLDLEIFCQQGLPEINADRGLLGQCLLQLCKSVMAVGSAKDKLVLDVRSQDRKVVFTLELARKGPREAMPTELSPAELAGFRALCELPTFRVIEEHRGTWECQPISGGLRRVVFDLPISGPSSLETASDGKTVSIPASRGNQLPLEPRLAAEVTNQLKNTLNVIRGYAEMALQTVEPERQRSALDYAINLSDQASELVDTLQPATGEFDLEVKLPADQAASDAEVEAMVGPVAEGAILVVDDDAAMRGLLVDVLKSAGYKTIEARDGKQAVEQIRLSPPALAFVDLSMPRVTGVEVMRESRKYAPGLPVVLMTGYATQVAVEALGEEKPYAILSKPFTIAEVLSLARAVVGEQSVQAG